MFIFREVLVALFYDTHAHLDYPEFSLEGAAILDRARSAGIAKVVCIGTDFESSRRGIALAEAFPEVYAAVGWHPSEALEAPDDIRETLRELAQHPKVVALGETGLDYYRLPSGQRGGTAEDDARYKQKQASLFRQHLEIAADLGLSCVIHQRSSFNDTVAQLAPFAQQVSGVFHCFAGTLDDLRQVLDLGSIVSFTGILTFKNGDNIRQALTATPMNKFMLETDSPYLAPVPYRGKRCEPAYVKEISECAAGIKGCSLEELSTATCGTAKRFFKKL